MKTEEFVIEQELRDIYYNPNTGYQSAERLYQKAKENGLNVSRKIVKDWLKTQDTFTRYKPIIRRNKFQRTFVKDLGDQIQMDLVDMRKYKNQNKGYYWILTAVEILRRYKVNLILEIVQIHLFNRVNNMVLPLKCTPNVFSFIPLTQSTIGMLFIYRWSA